MFTPTLNEVSLLPIEVRRTDDGRLEGRVRPETTTTWQTFSGVLELLKVLEELLQTEDPESPTLNNPKETGK